MITKDSVFKIGRLQKSHGIKGEISIVYDKPQYADIDVDFYFMDIDSIYVPFLIEEVNFMSDNRGRVKFENIENETDASQYSNIEIYVLKKDIPEIEDSMSTDWDWFIGYKIIAQDNNNIGKIVDVDSSTMNILFIVKNDDTGEEHLIPATEDFIIEIDEENNTMYLNLPEGLLE